MMVRSISRGDIHLFTDDQGRELIRIEVIANRPGSRSHRLRFLFHDSIKLTVYTRPPESTGPTIANDRAANPPGLLERASNNPRPGPPLARRPKP